jgi:uncharacterized membrane protein
MTEITTAIAHTPIWVWPLFVLILYLGARNLKERERTPISLIVLPLVMLGFALVNLVMNSADKTLAIPAFIFSFIIGNAIGWNLVPKSLAADRERGTVRVPGSVAPLLVVVAIVLLRYAIGYTYGRWPEMRTDPALALEFSATGALLAGIVWGRIVRIAAIYRRS